MDNSQPGLFLDRTPDRSRSHSAPGDRLRGLWRHAWPAAAIIVFVLAAAALMMLPQPAPDPDSLMLSIPGP